MGSGEAGLDRTQDHGGRAERALRPRHGIRSRARSDRAGGRCGQQHGNSSSDLGQNALADVWDWDPIAGTWTQRLTGSESNLPAARMYASLVTDSSQGRLDLVAGWFGGSQPTARSHRQSCGNWILSQQRLPTRHRRGTHRAGVFAIPWPSVQPPAKTYVFGGEDSQTQMLNDLWEWDGKAWLEIKSDVQPSARADTAMAYDPSRKSLILFGGTNDQLVTSSTYGLSDTWEWQSATRQWTQLHPASSPDSLFSHGMVTDMGRAKVLIFGGQTGVDPFFQIAPWWFCREPICVGVGWREDDLDQPHTYGWLGHPGSAPLDRGLERQYGIDL